ncbi:ABC transporter substrate-binding protein [Achromobacter sp. F4_2707]|uniref:ABC transporter substrate-binding protein n=1 Tax=Achromobacter sp. F4_2707 TaxID=3114286 RepID=UPI0039C5C105
MIPIKTKALIGAVTMALSMLSGAAQAEELRIGVRAGPEAMDPHYMALGNQIAAVKNIYEALVAFDENLQIKPGLAESWKPVDDNTWEFQLRQGVKFHDGSPLTAEDVKFSLERVPGAAGPDGGLIINTRNISEVEVTGPHTIHITTSVPNPALPQDLARVGIVPKSIGNASVEDFNNGKAAIGTGPFKLVSFTAREGFELQRNADYWGGEVPWEKVNFIEISNDAARVAALQSNRVDVVNYVPFGDVERLRNSKDTQEIQGESIYVFLLYPDHRPQSDLVTDKNGNPLPSNPLADRRVREALSLAINRKAIVERALEGFAKPANQLIDDKFFGAIPNPKELAYDPDRARELLAEAGYPDGFKLPLHCTNDRLPGDGATCRALGQMFSRIGIDTSVNAISRTVFVPARTRGDYVLTMAGWGSVSGEAGYTMSSIAHTNDSSKGLGAFNVSHVSNPKSDELIAKAMRTLDDAERRKLFEESMATVLEDFAIIPVLQLSSVWGVKADKVTFTPRVDEETLPYFMQPVK